MKIGIAQINTTVGALDGNTRKILDTYQQLCDNGADLVLTPELAVAGYPPRDLLLRSRFLADCAESVRGIAAATGAVPLAVGFPERNEGPGRPAFNAVAWCCDGKIQRVFRKSLLPTYDVFDEDRYFEPSEPDRPIHFGGRTIAVSICEDLWHGLDGQRYSHRADPVEKIAEWKPDKREFFFTNGKWYFLRDGYFRSKQGFEITVDSKGKITHICYKMKWDESTSK